MSCFGMQQSRHRGFRPHVLTTLYSQGEQKLIASAQNHQRVSRSCPKRVRSLASIPLALARDPFSSTAVATERSISRSPPTSVEAGVGAPPGSASSTGIPADTAAPKDAGVSTITSATGATSVWASSSSSSCTAQGSSTTVTLAAAAGASTRSSEARWSVPVSIAPDTGSIGSALETATVSLVIEDEGRTG